MSSFWTTETCPCCRSANWIDNGDPSDGDPSKMDVSVYTCWKCGNDIRLAAGEFGDEYKPHLLGTMPHDDEDVGDHTNGLQFPNVGTPITK